MKRPWLALVILLLLVIPPTVHAQFEYSINSDDTLTLTNYSGTGGAVIIPTNYNGMTVTRIGDYAFESSYVSSVVIPGTVTSIGDYAFSFCAYLTGITIPNSVTHLCVAPFDACTLLSGITVEQGDSYYISVNGVLFDEGKTTLVEFPAGLGGSYAIPPGVTTIGSNAFSDSVLLTNVVIPDSVTSIGFQAFSDCRGLTSMIIPQGVTSIGFQAFGNCFGMTNVTIPNSVTSIGDYAFSLTFLTSVTIPSSVTSIGNWVFYECTLTNVSIPNTVTSIGEGAFSASYLDNVTIPSGITNIGFEAFFGCFGLSNVVFMGNAPPPETSVFVNDPFATAFYLPGTTGWNSMFDGIPTALLLLPNPTILNNSPSLGVQSDTFGFIVSWATNATVVVEATTNLSNPVWSPIATNVLTNGSFLFSEPLQTNNSGRYYRIIKD